MFDNEIAVLIGTGIGVTPWASILKNIWHKRDNPGSTPLRLRRVEFIWVCRDISSFEWFQNLLSSLERQSDSKSHEFLRIHTYLTQRLDVDTAQNIVLNSVGMEVDPLTQLRTGTQYGRPDFPKLFTTMRDGIMDQSYITGLEGTLRTNVGVYFCGPSAAARSIRKACATASTPEVNFGFWKEQYVITDTNIKLSNYTDILIAFKSILSSFDIPPPDLSFCISGLHVGVAAAAAEEFSLLFCGR